MRVWALALRVEHAACYYPRFWCRGTLRLLLAVALTAPRRIPRGLGMYWRRWAALPGDEWENFQCAMRASVVKVTRDSVILDVRPGQACGSGANIAHERRAINRDDWAWQPIE